LNENAKELIKDYQEIFSGKISVTDEKILTKFQLYGTKDKDVIRGKARAPVFNQGLFLYGWGGNDILEGSQYADKLLGEMDKLTERLIVPAPPSDGLTPGAANP